MRISDWSSDVCSSYLPGNGIESISQTGQQRLPLRRQFKRVRMSQKQRKDKTIFQQTDQATYRSLGDVQLSCRGRETAKIGRASCRERVCQSVYTSVVAVSLKKKKQQSMT